ncbi:protein rolling stone-like [Melitaea cinxia]|uniref:protein rolling stone-like n=1 Tax=Melitaea cinxia TaxID=113334 RepID=UPI001E27082D|nr:protein rolling stone-like [Melitaea cinxia]
MNTVKKYFKEECQLLMLSLGHPKTSDFFISVWQTTRSPLPLLVWRTLFFLSSLSIVITSLVYYIKSPVSVSFWFIYITHWGLVLNMFATGFGTAISARCYFYGPISAEFNLPWYVKTFWVLHNVSVPLAFLITLFYWTVLFNANFLEEMNQALDIAIHGINSLIMFIHHMTSSHPTRLLHLVHPFALALVYVFFNIIYYLAGGTDPLGQPFIYPVINWSQPGSATVVVIVTGLLLICLHFVTIGLGMARDAIANRILRPSVAVHVDEDIALHNTNPQTTMV